MTDDPTTRRKRVALLSTEVDVQRQAATDRATSVQTKASFLVLGAGLFTGVTFLGGPAAVAAETFAVLGFLVTIISAAVALWPANLSVIDPRRLKDHWIDADGSDYELEVFLLQAKVQAYEDQQVRTNARVVALKIGFLVFALSVGLDFVVILVRAFS